jgi:hypothetical protein
MLACSCDSVIICKNYQSFFSFQGGFLTRKLYRRYSLETSRLVRSPTASRSPLFEGGHAFSDRVTCPRYVLSISFICAMCRTLRLYLFSLASFMPGSCSTTPQSASQTAPQAWGALNVSTCTGFSTSPEHRSHIYSAAIRPPPSRVPHPAPRTPLFFLACVHSPYILVPHQRHTFPNPQSLIPNSFLPYGLFNPVKAHSPYIFCAASAAPPSR